jgi:hypothetical protein
MADLTSDRYLISTSGTLVDLSYSWTGASHVGGERYELHVLCVTLAETLQRLSLFTGMENAV